MKNKEILKKINSVLLCLMAHPDNEPDSEFADRISDLEEIQKALKLKLWDGVRGNGKST